MKLEELTIVGFEGTVKEVECGSELPVYCHAELNRYFIPSTVKVCLSGVFWFSREEFNAYVAEGRCTQLPVPMPAPPDAVILYVTGALLKELGTELPPSFGWQLLKESPEPAYVACGSADHVNAQLDAWGKILMEKGDRLFTQFLSGPGQDQILRQRIEAIFRLARSAADSPPLRREIFVRYGAVRMYCHEESALRQMFALLQLSYSDWTWDDLQEQIKMYLVGVRPQPLAMAAAARQAGRQTDGSPTHTSAEVQASLLNKVRRDANTSHVQLTQAEGDLLKSEPAVVNNQVLQQVGKGDYLLNLLELLKQIKQLPKVALGALGRAIHAKLIRM